MEDYALSEKNIESSGFYLIIFISLLRILVSFYQIRLHYHFLHVYILLFVIFLIFMCFVNVIVMNTFRTENCMSPTWFR